MGASWCKHAGKLFSIHEQITSLIMCISCKKKKLFFCTFLPRVQLVKPFFALSLKTDYSKYKNIEICLLIAYLKLTLLCSTGYVYWFGGEMEPARMTYLEIIETMILNISKKKKNSDNR